MLLGLVNKTTAVVWPVVCRLYYGVHSLTFSASSSACSPYLLFWRFSGVRAWDTRDHPVSPHTKFLSAKGLKPTGPSLTTELGNRCTFALWSSRQMLLRHIVSGSLEGTMGLSTCGGQLGKASLCSLSFAVRSLCPLPWNHFANKPCGRKPLSQAAVLGDSV